MWLWLKSRCVIFFSPFPLALRIPPGRTLPTGLLPRQRHATLPLARKPHRLPRIQNTLIRARRLPPHLLPVALHPRQQRERALLLALRTHLVRRELALDPAQLLLPVERLVEFAHGRGAEARRRERLVELGFAGGALIAGGVGEALFFVLGDALFALVARGLARVEVDGWDMLA